MGRDPASTRARFRDRASAGRALAAELERHRCDWPIILGLSEGGLAVAYEVARELEADLDVCVVRKLTLRDRPGILIGALSETGSVVLDTRWMRLVGAPDGAVEDCVREQRLVIEQLGRQYRRGLPALDLRDRVCILVDDAIASGATMRAALRDARKRAATRVLVAAPVGAAHTLDNLRPKVDGLVVLHWPGQVGPVSDWYEEPEPSSPWDAAELLTRGRQRANSTPPRSGAIPRELILRTADAPLRASLSIPDGALGLVLCAGNGGIGRGSPLHRAATQALNDAGLGSLVFDLLTDGEAHLDEYSRRFRLNIDLLASRWRGAAEWARSDARLEQLPIGFFSSNMGAAAALVAAASDEGRLGAVVTVCGRADLARDHLQRIGAPTLLVSSSEEQEVGRHQALTALLSPKSELMVLPSSAKLHEEPSMLRLALQWSVDWFTRHLSRCRSEALGA